MTDINEAIPDADGLFTMGSPGARLFLHIACTLQIQGGDPRWDGWADSTLNEMLEAAHKGGLSAARAWEVEQFCYVAGRKLTGFAIAAVHEAALLAEIASPGIGRRLTEQMERIARA